MSAEERAKYNAYLRELIEAVGITLAKATAGALLWNSGGRHPCPKTAVRASSALLLTGVDEGDSSDTEAVEARAAAGSQYQPPRCPLLQLETRSDQFSSMQKPCSRVN